MKFITALLISLFVSTPLVAEEANAWPHNLAGVYKRQFKNTSLDVPSYTSEDILELVSIDPKHLYIRAKLPAENGHGCSFSGWLTAKDAQTLAYHHAPVEDREGPNFHPVIKACEMLLHIKNGKIVFDPQSIDCNYRNCSARGSIHGTEFKLSAKRPIRYMERLRNSDEYKETLAAIEEEERLNH